MSWVPVIEVEGDWVANGMRFATREEAERWGSDLMSRWFSSTDRRADESSDRVTYRLEQDGTLVRLCDACDLPRIEGDTYCAGHARLLDYQPGGGIAANE